MGIGNVAIHLLHEVIGLKRCIYLLLQDKTKKDIFTPLQRRS